MQTISSLLILLSWIISANPASPVAAIQLQRLPRGFIG